MGSGLSLSKSKRLLRLIGSGTDQTRTVSIVEGSSITPSNLASGGIEFDPVAGGMTSVSSSIPGFIATEQASQQVTVEAPEISMFGLPVTVGADCRPISMARVCEPAGRLRTWRRDRPDREQ